MSLWNVKLPLLPTGHKAAACCNVSVLASTKLLAWSETIITECMAGATAVSPVPTEYTGILEPNLASNVAFAHTLSEVQNCLTVVQVLNTTEDIELQAGQHLGEFYFLLLTQQFWRENVAMSYLIRVTTPAVSIDNSNLSTSQLRLSYRSLLPLLAVNSSDAPNYEAVYRLSQLQAKARENCKKAHLRQLRNCNKN